MNSRQNIALSLAALVMFSMLLFIIFGDNGFADLKVMKSGRDSLVIKNEVLLRKNLSLYHTIQRLKNDNEFIENVARQELGLVGRQELVFKMMNTDQRGLEQ